MNTGTLLLIHAAATWFLTGLIWLVQLVHYPLFARVGAAGYRDYQLGHQSLISVVVGPAMLVEAAAAIWILALIRTPLTIAGGMLLAVIWCSTALIQVPLHNTLTKGFHVETQERLVRTNWVRTVAWTIRGVIALYILRTTE